METQEFIPVEVFCSQYGVAITFISTLQEFGLIEIETVGEVASIHINQLPEAEKLLHLHEDLSINMEGIDVVIHLLNRIKEMQNEIHVLRMRLNLYEDEK
jgi:chaperone modulatory protein CbpM